MSETKHTPEPWEIFGSDKNRIGHGQEAVASTHTYFNHRDEANARRIVACVNACAGISTEKLEENAADPIAGLFGRMAAREGTRADKAESQRDELLAALKEIALPVLSYSDDCGYAYNTISELLKKYDHA